MGIPITIVTGFLGSGKTTIINQVLKDTTISENEIIIIENEFGSVGLDHELLLKTKETIFELNNGCVCCSLRNDLIAVFQSIKEIIIDQNHPLKKIIIETTGIADPQPIVQTIISLPSIANYFYIDSIITVVDGLNYAENKDKYSEFHKQLAMADALILSKADCLSETERTKIIYELNQINPLANKTDFWNNQFFSEEEFFDLKLFQQIPQIFEKGDEQIQHNHNHADFQTIYLTTEELLDEKLMNIWLEWLVFNNKGKLYRFKGLLNFKNRNLAIALQGVNQQINFELTNKPIAENKTKIILIGKEMKMQEIKETFADLINMSKTIKEE